MKLIPNMSVALEPGAFILFEGESRQKRKPSFKQKLKPSSELWALELLANVVKHQEMTHFRAFPCLQHLVTSGNKTNVDCPDTDHIYTCVKLPCGWRDSNLISAHKSQRHGHTCFIRHKHFRPVTVGCCFLATKHSSHTDSPAYIWQHHAFFTFWRMCITLVLYLIYKYI